jgi:hypothetical protein
MSTFKIFDGTNWVDPCKCNISILDIDGTTYQQIDPNNCIVSYFDGTNWCPITCPCECPAGYTFNPATNSCELPGTIEPAIPTGGTTIPIIDGDTSEAYSDFGARLYEDVSGKTYPLNGYQNPNGTLGCTSGTSCYLVRESAGTGPALVINQVSAPASDIFNSQGGSILGRLNIAGLWATGWPDGQWLTVEFCLDILATKTYIFAIAGDNKIRANITSTTFNGGVVDLNLVNLWDTSTANGTGGETTTSTFKFWHMFPITLPAGNHIFKLSGRNNSGERSFAAEIYDIPVGNAGDVWPTQQTLRALMTSTTATPADLGTFIAFSTESLKVTPPLVIPAFGQTITWSCPSGGTLDLCNGVPQCIVPGDSIPCGGGQPLSSTTEINIWFDNSGSMNTTLSPLQIMQSTILQACLLPIYNNDVTLYNERVKVLNMKNGSAWNYNERFVRCLATERNFNRTADTTVNQVINLTFADESDVYGYGGSATFNSSSRTSGYDTDIAYLRSVMSAVGYTIKGTAFRVNTGPNSFPGFKGLTQATFVNNGAYSVPNNISDYYTTNFNCNLDTLAAGSPTYYRDQIVAALTALGISIPVCP